MEFYILSITATEKHHYNKICWNPPNLTIPNIQYKDTPAYNYQFASIFMYIYLCKCLEAYKHSIYLAI